MPRLQRSVKKFRLYLPDKVKRPIQNLVLSSALLSGCGPTELEAGQAVLLVAPLLTLLGAALAGAYRHLWRPIVPKLRFSWGRSLQLAAVQVFVLVAAFLADSSVVSSRDLDDLGLFALWWVGTTYLSFALLCARIAVLSSVQRYFSWVSIAPWALLYLPAMWLGFFGSNTAEVGVFPGVLWLFPGYFGLTTVLLLLVFITEVMVRRRRIGTAARRALEPAPFPRATARLKK